MTKIDTGGLRVLKPFPHVLAFYDGRIEGHRYADGPNWIDDGALALGIASYALAVGEDAIVYDTHVSVDHGRYIRNYLEQQEGIKRITVVLSHWHLDHVAGNEAFADCEIVANRLTAGHLSQKKRGIEAGTLEGPPGISPLVEPGVLFDGRMKLKLGRLEVELIHANIHSDDATLIWLPQHRILLAGDTMEDTITYAGEPEHFDSHLTDLDKLWSLDPQRILPSHGCPDIISSGGYQKTLIRATQQYIRVLKRCVHDASLCEAPLRNVIAGPLDMGWVKYFQPYEDVHRKNVELVLRKNQLPGL